MSKHKNQTKRYPLVEARLRLWLADQYRTRGLTGPWAINTRKVATDMGGFHGTIGAALAQFARMPNEGVVMISNGNYEYMPPRKPPTPSVLAGRTSSMAAPVRQAEPAKAAPAEPRKPKRQLDMTLRPKLIQFARDTWRAKGEVTIVTYGSVAAALGTKPSSTGAAMLVLSKEYPEVGYVRIGGGVYEIHRPKRIRPVAQEPDERPEYEPEPEEEPQHDAPPAQPEPQPGPPEPPPAVEPQPGPASAAAFNVHINRLTEEVLQRMEQNGRAPDWETVRKGENFAVLMDSDGGVWHARKLELS